MTASDEPQTWDPGSLKRRLQAMDDFDFEHLVADLWERQGWTTEVEQQSGDAGVDVRATKQTPYSQKILLQAKRYSSDNPLGGPDIQQYAALKHQEQNVDKAVVVTTGRFTNSAEDRADDLNVKLIDGDGLIQIIDQFDAYDIVEEYLGVPLQKEGHGTTSSDTTTDSPGLYLPPKQREVLSQKIDGDIDEYLRDQRYRGARALEQAQAKVKINPTEAAQLGAFDDVDGINIKRDFEQRKSEIALLSEHIHVDNDETAFIGDLTEFVSATAIDADANQNVVAIIERGVLDHAWAADGFFSSVIIKGAKNEESGSAFEFNISSKIEKIASRSEKLHYVAIGGFVSSVLGIFLIGAAPPESAIAAIGALMVLMMPFIGLGGLLLDLGYIRQHDAEWSPSIVLGILGAVVLSVFYFAYYVYKRRKYVGL
ncbi:restriction endonuclease [Halorubrum trapanicum]|uniref:restriction endonuclease n=1 Tax=Halorubrum trapanicum TaxID=29284 RepID=UPI0012FE5E9D|nr:restriction endonuclease [Halorubrum trapanicum]